MIYDHPATKRISLVLFSWLMITISPSASSQPAGTGPGNGIQSDITDLQQQIDNINRGPLVTNYACHNDPQDFQNIQTLVDTALTGDSIVLSGICMMTGTLKISRAEVTLSGDAILGAILDGLSIPLGSPALEVAGTPRVFLENIHINGGENSIMLNDTSVYASSVIVSPLSGDGFVIGNSGSLNCNDCETINGNIRVFGQMTFCGNTVINGVLQIDEGARTISSDRACNDSSTPRKLTVNSRFVMGLGSTSIFINTDVDVISQGIGMFVGNASTFIVQGGGSLNIDSHFAGMIVRTGSNIRLTRNNGTTTINTAGGNTAILAFDGSQITGSNIQLGANTGIPSISRLTVLNIDEGNGNGGGLSNISEVDCTGNSIAIKHGSDICIQ